LLCARLRVRAGLLHQLFLGLLSTVATYEINNRILEFPLNREVDSEEEVNEWLEAFDQVGKALALIADVRCLIR